MNKIIFKNRCQRKAIPPPKRKVKSICKMTSALIISILSANSFGFIGSRTS